MNDSFCWSATVGRWLGVPVRVHVLLILSIIAIFGIESQLLFSDGTIVWGTALVTSMVILASVVFHELAHIFAVTNLGGHANSVLLAPWGGNSDLAMPTASRARILVDLAGPLANLVIVLFGATLLIQTGQSTLGLLLNPFGPHGFHLDDWELSLAKITTWVNFQLLIVNLIPCFPFDGARVLRGIIEILNPDISRVHAEASVKVFGQAVAFTLIGAAWFLGNYHSAAVGPVWCLLVLLGVTLLFTARYSYLMETAHLDDDWEDLNEFDSLSLYDENSFLFSEDETSGYSQWLSEKQEARRREEERLENEELERSDLILEKLHRHGLDSLSEEERSLLKRVSDRLRRQRGEQQTK